MLKKHITQEIEIGGKKLILEYGKFAEQADSGILARLGDTQVLVTVVSSREDTSLPYFPLFVEYMERLYAGGKIKGSRWVKREGRPTDDEILAARLIDRSIRPLFPKAYKHEVQVVATVLSVDLENDPKLAAMVGVSAALATSRIPWNGPVGSLRVGMKEGTYFANPVDPELEFSDIDLVMTADENAILMIEAEAREVSEDKVLGALQFGVNTAAAIVSGIQELSTKVGVTKDVVVEEKYDDIADLINKEFGEQIDDYAKENIARESGDSSEIQAAVAEKVSEEKKHLVGMAFEKVLHSRMRRLILSGKRLDGRKHDEIRPISSEVGVLTRTHGSAFFQRGQTHVLTSTTLGPTSLEQTIESAEGEETKRYMHHYTFPPFSVGEVGRMGYPSRREIGHGALAERALMPVIPSEEEFPYAIRVVSEVVSSNGSTSMGSVCGSTLSLMDAGVPIKRPVSGIAMGLIIEDKDVAILSDIMGIEDANGDMDFKVAGTEKGVTAIQLDVKTSKLTTEVLGKALEQARVGRMFILEKILETLPAPREKVSQYAPKIEVVKVPKEKIGNVIGSGGSVIRKIMADTATTVDVEDDGEVTIAGADEESVKRAREIVESLVKEVEPGELYEGEVRRIEPFGAFVQILPGKDGLVHVSDMSTEYVRDPNDIVKLGDKVKVKVKEVDNLGRVNLTMLLNGEKKSETPRREDRRGDKPVGKRDFGRSRDGGSRDRSRSFGRSQDKRGGGPHFPTSRFMPKKKF